MIVHKKIKLKTNKKEVKKMCEIEKSGFKKDCIMCEGCFPENFYICPDKDPNLSQEMYDEIYEEW